MRNGQPTFFTVWPEFDVSKPADVETTMPTAIPARFKKNRRTGFNFLTSRSARSLDKARRMFHEGKLHSGEWVVRHEADDLFDDIR
jgi:hypothetical protein